VPETDQEDSQWLNGAETEDDETNVETQPNEPDIANHPMIWRKNTNFAPNVQEFVSYPSKVKDDQLQVLLNANPSPLKLLQYFLDETMVEEIIYESARYSKTIKTSYPNSLKNFKPFEKEEFWAFLGLNLLMGVVKKPTLKSYWSTNSILTTRVFNETMSRHRFEQILRSLHMADNRFPSKDDRFWKFGSFYPKIIEKFQNALNPGKFLSVDETLVGFKGRLSFKQYIPSKRSRFGAKFFVLVDHDTKFVVKLLAYQGKNTKYAIQPAELGSGGAAAFSLINEFFGRNHILVTDSRFSSPNFAAKLLENNTYLLGTVTKRRKNMPKMYGKLKKREVETFCTDKILVERYIQFIRTQV